MGLWKSKRKLVPWLKQELEKIGWGVFVPTFPTPENQTLINWLNVFKDYEKYLNEETIIIGHSLGCLFILDLLEKSNKKINSTFLVAGWTGLLNNPIDKINKTFVDKNFNWEKIKQNCDNFLIFNSNNDQYIKLDLGKNLDSGLIIIKNAGHFNKKAGYAKFEILLKHIKKVN